MSQNKLFEQLEKRLNAKNIYEIRQIARAVGVQSPSTGKKERLVGEILDIAAGKTDPAPHSVKGAPPKSVEYDRQLVADILNYRENILAETCDESNLKTELIVSSNPDIPDPTAFTASGLLERFDGKWFIRLNGCKDDNFDDVFVNETFITKYGLREGDVLCGECRRNSPNEIAGLAKIISVNGSLADNLKRRNFENLTPVYPDRKLSCGADVTGRIIDILSPIGAGQRAMLFSPPVSDKTAILKDIAKGIANSKDVKLILLLIDARPEEASDFRRAFHEADLFVSNIGVSSNCHIRTANLALNYAKRQVEYNRNVVLIVDDLTRLARAYNSSGKLISPSLSSSALDGAKRFFAAARNAEEGGSLTIVSAITSESGDAIDEAIYSGLKDLCNMRIVLSSKLSRQRVYPPIDIVNSYASDEEKLLSSEHLKAADKLRVLAETSGVDKVIALFSNTNSDKELFDNLNN